MKKNLYQKNWNLKLLYKSEKDPQIEKDVKTYEQAIKKFVAKYQKNKNYLKDSNALLTALNEKEKILAMTEGAKTLIYYHYRLSLNSNDKTATAEANRLGQFYDKINNSLMFFGLDLAKVSKEVQKKFLADKKLSKYHYYLKVIFENAKHHLTEPEEKIMNLMSTPARGMWIDGFEKVLSNQEVIFKNKKMPLSEAGAKISELSKKDRRVMSKLIREKLKGISDFAEAELNALFYKKKISDELRGYEKPYTATVKGYENEIQTVENLVEVVTKNFKISHRFYKLKAKMMNEKTLNYEDRNAKIGESKTKFDFDKTTKLITEAFAKISPFYAETFEKYLKNGQIDVFPKKGKSGGAFCSHSYGLPVFVLLNHVDNFDSVTTLAHEMGHAFHSEWSEKQSPFYADYTIAVAEVASTFFENFIFDFIFEKLSDKEKIIALHEKINSQISTVFRQIACFNFELEAHETARKKGFISKEEMAEIMKKHMKNYLGPVFKMKEDDGYIFVSWPHIRNHFYVYSYAFGSLISDALYAEYKKDAKYLGKIENFLKAGSTKCPEDIFADAGINIRNPKFFEKGLKQIEDNVKKLERLVLRK